MRKLILISALLCLASASAQAEERRGLVLAAADTPAAASTDSIPRPLPPVSKNDTDKPQASAPADQSRGSKPQAQSRRYDGDEAKARRIAAKYGISW
jgi:hypothetical protein